MAHDAESSRTRSRRLSSGLDPNRSSVRRTQSRRSISARVSPPPRIIDSGSSSAPRNRRVARSSLPAPSGPPLRERVVQSWAQLREGLRARVATVRALLARLRGPTSFLATMLAVCVAVAGATALGRSVHRHLTTAPAFAIDTIDVKGLTRLDRGELLDAAGLELGTNVFARSPDEVRARLLRHPWILGATVERRLPSRFEIAVREREPVALMVLEACGKPSHRNGSEVEDAACDEPSSLYLVSEDARMFKRLSGKDPVDLPVITGLTRQRAAADPELSRRVLAESVALMHEYRNAGLADREPLGEVHLEANDGFSLYVGKDLTYVRLGQPPFALKLQRMKKVFERLAAEQARAEYVYLDNEQRPERVAVRLR